MVHYLKTPANQAAQDTKPNPDISATVRGVIEDIRTNGDAAVRKYSEKFDNWSPPSFKLTQTDISAALAACPAQLLDDIKTVQASVRHFAEAQRASLQDFEIETQPGVFLGQKNIPIATAGAYIPGGRYPLLASAHMTILTAKVAGVAHVTACTPPLPSGAIPHATVAAMHLAGADAICILGGVQAVAAMAVGTAEIPKADFIAGPGNAFVAEAKRQLFGEVGIDLFAGPTEVLIVADETADPWTVAVDLVAQAEHGPDSPAVAVVTDEGVGRRVVEAVGELLEGGLATREVAAEAWRACGECVVVEGGLEEAWAVADGYASEHVQVLTRRPREALGKMRNYGALFLGEMTCVAYGDKVIGTNHVLPTRKAARYTGGLWVGKFLKTVTYQEVTNEQSSGELGRLCGRAARVEKFEAHARSGDLRAQKYLGDEYEWISQHKAGEAKAAGL